MKETEKIYRFLIWDSYDSSNRIITHNEIKLNNPEPWNAEDYGEWKLPFDWWENEDKINNKLYERAAIEVMTIGIETLEVVDVEEHYNNLKLAFWDTKNLDKLESEFFDELYACTGAFCTSVEWDNVKMWETWGNLGEGYCVGLNLSELRKVEKLRGLNSPVNYYSSNSIPKISIFEPKTLENTIGDFHKQLFSVPARLDYEKEFRFTKINSDEKGFPYPYTTDDRIVKLPISCYDSIYFGYEISSQDKQEILNCIDVLLPDVKKFQLSYENKRLLINPE